MSSEKTNTKLPATGASQPVKDSTQQIFPRAQIPSPVMFLLVVLSSLGISSGLLALTSPLHHDELRTVGKQLDSGWEVGGLVAWRAVEIGLAWLSGYDAHGVYLFMSLIHYPTFMLLSMFYNIRPTAVLVTYLIAVFSPNITFSFFRGLSYIYNPDRVPFNKTSNRSILQDYPTAIYTTIVATSIFTVTLYVSFVTWLPAHLVVHFEDIPNISLTHTGPRCVPIIFLWHLLPGWAAKQFLFVSSAGAQDGSGSSSVSSPDKHQPSGGWKIKNYACAIYRRTWGALTVKRRVLIQRALTLAAMMVLGTTVQLVGTVQGVDVQGASAWGAIWSFATLVTALVYGWIESVDGV